MRVFIDTEFTSLSPGYKLISIALVDEDENFFYAELNDTYTLKDCSDFVKTDVLPYLKGGKYVMSEYDCKLSICKWIEERNQPCVVCTDAPGWDLPLFLPLLQPCVPENLNITAPVLVRVPDDVSESIVASFNYDIHNALDDAMVMKKGMLGY
jgi:hypothetical protein